GGLLLLRDGWGALNLGLVPHRKREAKYGPARRARVRPQAPAMRFDDRATDRQADPHAPVLGRDEGLEDALAIRYDDSGPRVAYPNEQAFRGARFGADRELPFFLFDPRHGLDRIHDQIQHDLL